MPEDIRESFLRDAKEVSFHFQRQASNPRHRFKYNTYSAPLREVFDVLAQTNHEADCIEYRRV